MCKNACLGSTLSPKFSASFKVAFAYNLIQPTDNCKKSPSPPSLYICLASNFVSNRESLPSKNHCYLPNTQFIIDQAFQIHSRLRKKKVVYTQASKYK